MKSVFRLSVSHFAAAVVAAALTGAASPAVAADLGGNCCADLEERIAELESTTARKGNRKVSLTVTGWVNEMIQFWDDGSDRNTYVGTNALEQSRVKFTGEAQISAGWSAGYTIELGIQGHPSNKWDQFSDGSSDAASPDNLVSVRKSNWFIKSKDYGKVTVGLEGTATYHLLDDADGVNTRNYSDAQAAAVYQGRFFLKSGGATFGSAAGLRWSDVLRGVDNNTPGQNGRRNIIRYDSPTLHGFTATASWGEDDAGGVSLTYKDNWGDFAVLARAGWEQTSDENNTTCHTSINAGLITSPQDCQWWGGAGTIVHKPTGLYVYGGYGQNHDNSRDFLTPIAAKPLVEKDDVMWFLQAGIERKWHPIGTTTLFGEYRHDDPGSNVSAASGLPSTQSADLDFWAAGIVQNIEPAAMDVYVMWRHAEGDVTLGSGANVALDDFDMVLGGARIQF